MPIRMPDPLQSCLAERTAPIATWRDACRQHRATVLASFAVRMAGDLVRVLADFDGVVRVEERPEAFEWRDAFDGGERIHLPLARVERIDGDVAYVDAVPRSALARDPSLEGIRSRVELECAARGASYEVWTEEEILADPMAIGLASVAGTTERAAYRAGCASRGTPATCPPAVLSSISARLGLRALRPAGTSWCGRSGLTGIPMVPLRGLCTVGSDRLISWRPHDRLPPAALVVGSAGRATFPTHPPNHPDEPRREISFS